MIQLGKYGTSFVIHSSYWFNKEDSKNLIKHNQVWYEGRNCRIQEVYNKSIVLQLITNDPEEYIDINC